MDEVSPKCKIQVKWLAAPPLTYSEVLRGRTTPKNLQIVVVEEAYLELKENLFNVLTTGGYNLKYIDAQAGL